MNGPGVNPVLQRRRIEAELAAALLRRLEADVGPVRARAILVATLEDEAARQGRELAAGLPPGLAGLARLWEGLQAGGALELQVLESTPARLRLRVTRCRYAEMYRETGLERVGELLSCGRDEPLARAFDPRIRLGRSPTLLEGAPACELDYRLDDEEVP